MNLARIMDMHLSVYKYSMFLSSTSKLHALSSSTLIFLHTSSELRLSLRMICVIVNIRLLVNTQLTTQLENFTSVEFFHMWKIDVIYLDLCKVVDCLFHADFFSAPLSIERFPSPENTFNAVTYISHSQTICRMVRAVLININR